MVADFFKKRNREFSTKKLLWQAGALLFVLAVVFLAFEDYKIYQKKNELAAQINSYQNQISAIEKSSQDLKDKITNSDSTDYLEKIAYEQLDKQKPGEQEFIFITPQNEEEKPVVKENAWDAKNWTGWFSNAWNWIKGKF